MDQKALEACINQIIVLSDEDLSLLLRSTYNRQLKKGEALLKKGEVCRSFYLVDEGYLRTYYNKEEVAINLNFTFEGGFTSNFKSFKSKRPSEHIIEAGEDALVWIFDIDAIYDQLKEHPYVVKFFRRLALNMLVASEEHSDMFKISTPTERYRYIEKNNPQLLQRISLSQIATYLGVTRETLSRIRGKKY